MDKFEWQDGEVLEAPYIEIDGIKHYVQGGSFTGTPVTANNLNEMQNILINNIKIANESNIGYVKMIDGTLICYGKTNTFDIEYNSGVGGDVDLPVSFIDTDYIVVCSIMNGNDFWANGIEFKGTPVTTSKINLTGANYLSPGTALGIQGSFIAIGRWK